jgi:hypothetical protein|tara:strand:+ start:440 stop:655 length:216 start_codon:yes stop_codon:yes gene_type:complete
MSSPAKRLRRENAIERLKLAVASHEADTKLTSRILKDKKIVKTEDEVDKIRLKKLERAKLCLENTKSNLNK